MKKNLQTNDDKFILSNKEFASLLDNLNKSKDPQALFWKVVNHPRFLNSSKKNDILKSDCSLGSKACKVVNHPHLLTQVEAMEYVHISVLSEFKIWLSKFEVSYIKRKRQFLFRLSVLDEALLREELETL